jgi:hypothetical protein
MKKQYVLIGLILFIVGGAFPLPLKAGSLSQSQPYILTEKLMASTPQSDAEFGFSLSLSDDEQFLVIGAPSHNVGINNNQGQVFVFRREGNSWVEVQKLAASDGAANDLFGASLAIAGAPHYTILAGARGNDMGGNANIGAAYVFTFDGSVWTEHAKLVAIDPWEFSYDYRGTSVAISKDGNLAMVGAPGVSGPGGTKPGAVYIFTRSGDNWTQTQKITGPIGGAGGLGSSMLLAGDDQTLFVQGRYSPVGPVITWSLVRVYQKLNGDWTEVDTLIPSDSQEFDDFGQGMAATADGSLILIGAPNRDGSTGKVYEFTESGGTWTEQAMLTPPTNSTYGYFGKAIALDAGTTQAAIGAFLNGSGAIHRFERRGDEWTFVQTLTTPDTRQEHLGFSVAMSGDARMIIGGARWAHRNLATFDTIGAIYIYKPAYQVFLPTVLR